jgi:hypothetical protein
MKYIVIIALVSVLVACGDRGSKADIK